MKYVFQESVVCLEFGIFERKALRKRYREDGELLKIIVFFLHDDIEGE